MFTDEELKDYAKKLQQFGIAGEKQQKIILEFFYTLGIIIYNYSMSNDEKEK